MGKQTRKQKVLEMIQNASAPISASTIAKSLNVSRQIIVGDVALLRAEGYDILSTFKGYQIEGINHTYTLQIACNHDASKTEEELFTIIDEGATVLDVFIEHPIYGELKGILNLRSRRDVINFIEKCNHHPTMLLSHLTGGIHLHTIACDNEEMANRIKNILMEKGILYSE